VLRALGCLCSAALGDGGAGTDSSYVGGQGWLRHAMLRGLERAFLK